MARAEDDAFRLRDGLLGAQMLGVAFGSLVPLLTGLDPNVALFTASAGTLIFQIVTGGRVPIFLASSFAVIAPIIYGMAHRGIPATRGGLMAAGSVYIVIAALVAVQLAAGYHGNGDNCLVAAGPASIVAFVSLGTVLTFSRLGRDVLKLIFGVTAGHIVKR